MNLDTPIEKIPRLTPAYQKKLRRMGIKTLRDLFFHFPHRYEDFSKIIPISQVKLNETSCIQGKILAIENRRTPFKRMILTEAIVKDQSGSLRVVWFNQPYLIRILNKESRVCLAGKVVLGEGGTYLSNPAYEKISSRVELIHTGRIVAVYPETEGLSSRWLRYILRPLLKKNLAEIPETLPPQIRQQENLLPLRQALWQVHFPNSHQLAQAAQKRLAFEELFLLSLFVLKEKLKIGREKGIAIPLNLKLIQKFVGQLPFKLTGAQKKSAWQILKDLEKPRPMNRLLEGDVGSGKTIVAAIAALNTGRAGFQVALMAPTEILARQHFEEIARLLKSFGLEIGLLTGKESKVFKKNQVRALQRREILELLKQGKPDFLIGTHALIQAQVKFKNLALVILDEQHRFGVEQRARLCQQSTVPHLFSMTATPIPRTLSLTLYGDLDLSLIDELPRGRKKIITKIVPPAKREKAYQFIRAQTQKARQVFVICPRIEPSSETSPSTSWAEVKAVKEEYEKLSQRIFPDLKIAALHGKMKSKEKEEVMQNFKNQKTDLLVATSVVEVGIDVPNASVMMIEGAERFGLAQLHQFRGRVGRSKHQSYCFLFTDSPARDTRRRLEALTKSQDGFELAEKDLKIRGPGDFLGTRQWGIPGLVMASLSDLKLVQRTRNAAQAILQEDPELKQYPFLLKEVEKFREKIHLE